MLGRVVVVVFLLDGLLSGESKRRRLADFDDGLIGR